MILNRVELPKNLTLRSALGARHSSAGYPARSGASLFVAGNDRATGVARPRQMTAPLGIKNLVQPDAERS